LNGILCIVHFVPRIRRDEYPFSGCVEHKMVSATVGQLGSDGDGTGYGDEHLLCFVMRMFAAFYGLRCCVSPEDPFDGKGYLLFELRNGNMAFFNISFAVKFNQVGFLGGVWFYDGLHVLYLRASGLFKIASAFCEGLANYVFHRFDCT